MKACFMGFGYIGLPTAIIAAKHGIQVIGVDINPEVVDKTNNGCLHFIEPGLEGMLKEVVRDGVFHAALKPEHSDAFFIVVGDPYSHSVSRGREFICDRIHFSCRYDG